MIYQKGMAQTGVEALSLFRLVYPKQTLFIKLKKVLHNACIILTSNLIVHISIRLCTL